MTDKKAFTSDNLTGFGLPHDSAMQAKQPDYNNDAPGQNTVNHSIVRLAKFALGDLVRHRIFAFRGVVLDIDFTFDHTEEWYNAIPPEMRPHKDQPFYHLLAEKENKSTYLAYVSEQNLQRDHDKAAIDSPQMKLLFNGNEKEGWKPRRTLH